MKKTVLTWGLISGAFSTTLMLGTVSIADRVGFDKAEILGYSSLVLSALLVFFGVRSYRENFSAGRLTFGRGFLVGLVIALVSATCYVATWEVLYFTTMPDFLDKYAAHRIEKARASGATPEKLAEIHKDNDDFKRMYDNNPLFNVAVTFLEPLPIGLLAAAGSAAALRRK